MKPIHWRFAACLLLMGLTSNLMATAAMESNHVMDQGSFFSSEAIQKANEQIDRFMTNGRQIIIETFPSIPDNRKASFKEDNKEPFFKEWAMERMQERQVNGVYVLICKEPSFLEVGVSSSVFPRLFNANNRELLTKELIALFKQKKYDEGLLMITQSVPRMMRENARGGVRVGMVRIEAPPEFERKLASGEIKAPNAEPEQGFSILWIVAGVLGIWILFGLIRALLRPATPPQQASGAMAMEGAGSDQAGGYARPTPLYGRGGGGFFNTFLGGMFGAAAGHYIYDSFFRSAPTSSGSAFGTGEVTPPAAGSGPAYGDQFSLGEDDRFGGGDYGGGDFGGDFGGGEF